jgi:hypothetical protein
LKIPVREKLKRKTFLFYKFKNRKKRRTISCLKITALCAKGPFGTCPREKSKKENFFFYKFKIGKKRRIILILENSSKGKIKNEDISFFINSKMEKKEGSFSYLKITALCAKGPFGTCPREN